MSEHTVKAYDAELDLIGSKIAEMGGIAEKMLIEAMDALSKLDVELARRVLNSDTRLDALQREVEELVVRTIVRRQPMAIDLRDLMASVHIAGDLERTGDLAKNIAKRAIKVADDPRVTRAVVGLKHMAEVAAMQLKDVLDAYAQRDVERAKAVWSRDAELDALEDSIFRDLLTFMMEDPRNISFCTHLLFCAKNLERVGDHATNIAENVHFMVTGAALPVNRPKGE
ncbi:MAG: phosphate signaling complex protein PhoU [Beijerinckiaceae bacterium]|nr:phosphate signaling complex protein PhoU [Beijerinckiaceae bacterium]